ncbi:MAG: SGNH/GDSL hydrolase family protein [Xanthomonadales bacterium]|nr:SGNH/GDSL hydrolase family protein [Xanthomonadales bacterium]
MDSDNRTVAAGSEAAKHVIAQRMAFLAEQVALPELVRSLTPESESSLGAAGIAALRANAPKAVLVAEGDSWFDYPPADVLDAIEDHHGYRVERVARRGDTVEDMAFSPSQIEKLVRCIERIIQDRKPVKAVLLSGGGNDIAGEEFSMLLEHSLSGKAPVNAMIAEQLINGRIRDSLLRLIGTVNTVFESYLGERVPIIIHGYGYPVADGRGFLGGWWFLPGPWLSPGFERKGILDMTARQQVMRHLIDMFNTMLSDLASDVANGVIYVDVRPLLTDNLNNYKEDWANELHPSQEGFKRVAARIAGAIP